MSDRGLRAADAYPERQEGRPSAVGKILRSLAYLPARALAGTTLTRFRPPSGGSGPVDPDAALRQLRYDLRRDGLRADLVARALHLLARECESVLGRPPSQAELVAARWLALGGRCVEMPDIGAWPLAAGLAAATAALAGLHVHVIVTTGFVARRDAQALGPLLEALALTGGVVDEGMADADRRAAYGADITWGVHRVVALDYLRDRLVLKGRPRAVRLRTEALTSHAPRMQQVMLRGLQFAIVCEAETVLVDAAQWPVTVMADASDSQEVAWLTQALALAGMLTPEVHFEVEGGAIALTPAGSERLASAVRHLPGHWQGTKRREDIVRLALQARHLLHRDEHYSVMGSNLQPSEEALRQAAPEASTRRLLGMLLEIKEACAVTGTREVLGRIGYQRFFRRYLRCAALSATARGLGPELWKVYGLRLLFLAARRPAPRMRRRDRIAPDHQRAAEAILGRLRELQGRGIPVLVATRTPQAAAALADALKGAGIECLRLAGNQSDEEAVAFAQAAQAGRVTITPHFAARGVCVDGDHLHILYAQLLPSHRHEQALQMRCLKHGTSGSCERILAMNDDLLTTYAPPWVRRSMRAMPSALLGLCQWRAGRDFAHGRSELFRTEEYLGDVLAFSGGPI